MFRRPLYYSGSKLVPPLLFAFPLPPLLAPAHLALSADLRHLRHLRSQRLVQRAVSPLGGLRVLFDDQKIVQGLSRLLPYTTLGPLLLYEFVLCFVGVLVCIIVACHKSDIHTVPLDGIVFYREV